MLEILRADFGSSRYDLLFKKIDLCRKSGKRIFLVVPEQQTLLCESESAKRLPPESALTFEVTNLSRLANTVFRTEGGIAGEYADNTVMALLTWRALSESQNSLSSAMRGPIGAGSVSKALHAVREMQSLGIDSALLKTTAEGLSLSAGRLQNKLSDLSVIMTSLSDLIGKKFTDIAEDTGEMTRKVEDNPSIFEEAEFYFDGFTSFTEPQYEFLRVLMTYYPVHVCLILPKGCEDAFEFTECRETEKRLSTLANDVKVPFAENSLGTAEFLHTGLASLSRILWRTNASLPKEEASDVANSLKIVRTSNPHEEMAYLASDIKKRVNEGARYSDFAVIMRSAESYLGFVDTALSENGIPAFVSNGKDVNSFEAVKLIRSAYRCVSAFFDRADVITYAKCPLSGITRDECDDFELYTEKWGINHGRFVSENRWNMNPQGYEVLFTSQDEKFLDRIAKIREKIVSPLYDLYNDSVGVHTVTEHAKNLIDFLLKIDLEKSLQKRADELYRAGETELAEENGRLFSAILSAIEKLENTLGDFTADAKTFTAILDIAFSSVEIERIPSFVDEVTVGSADMIRLSKKKYVYLVGVNEGEFPALSNGDSYFSEKEKQTLRELGLKTEPNTDVKLAREYFIFTRAFMSADEGVTLVYTERNASFGSTKPASVLLRIEALFKEAYQTAGVTDAPSVHTVWSALPLEERVYTPTVGVDLLKFGDFSESASSLKEALTKTELSKNLEIGEGEIENNNLRLTDEGIRMLYPGDISVSKSSLETYRDCPMKHYLTYGLRLTDKNTAEFDAANVGTLIHAVLETYLKDLKNSDRDLSLVTDDELYEKVKTIVDSYVTSVQKETPTERQSHFYEKLLRSAKIVTKSVFEDVKASKFTPQFFELKMDDNDETLPEPLYVTLADGTKVDVNGIIDRVDTVRDGNRIFVRVVDYKTGKISFKRSGLSEGENLQMFLYMRAVTESERFRKQLGAEEGDEVLPGCVMYMNTKLDADTATKPEDASSMIEKSQTATGMVNTDPVVVDAMNPAKKIISYNKDGTLNKKTADKAFTTATWGDVCDEVTKAVCKIAGQMKSGNISAKPIKKSDTCKYCQYAPVCRHKY